MTETSSPGLIGAENIRWDLSDLFDSPKDHRIQTILKDSVKASKSFRENYSGKIASLNASQLRQAYDALVEIYTPVYKVSQYANLLLSADTSDPEVKQLVAKVDEVFSTVSNDLIFFDLELGKIPEEKFEQFKDDDVLGEFRYSFIRTREMAKHQLSEGEERINTLKNITGKTAFKNLYGEFTSSFEYEFDVDGNIRKYTGDEMRALRYHPDANVRRRAMETFFKKYEENKIVFTAIFNSIFKDYNILKNLRGYSSPINVRNTENDLDDNVVEMLIQVTTESNKLVNRYYNLKKKLLGLDKITLADIYAPLPESDKAFTWDESKELVLQAFQSFDDDFHTKAKLMFDNRRIDGPIVKNKRGGAFCSSSTPDLPPYVLLNFTGKVRDVSTMAHELGHAIHSMYSQRQNIFNFHPILPLAETASVFSEMILTDMLLNTISDDNLKISLISTKLEDIFSTSHRQNMFTRFEITAHDQVEDHLLTAEELCTIYRKELEIMFGDSVEYSDEYRWEWSSIPHMINVPFYVYAYNFANLLVLSLYQQYLEDGEDFIPRFKEFLSMGSSARPTEIIAIMGQDISDRNFWQKSIIYIESMIDKLEALIS